MTKTQFLLIEGDFAVDSHLLLGAFMQRRDSESQACDLVSFVAPPGMEIERSFH